MGGFLLGKGKRGLYTVGRGELTWRGGRVFRVGLVVVAELFDGVGGKKKARLEFKRAPFVSLSVSASAEGGSW